MLLYKFFHAKTRLEFDDFDSYIRSIRTGVGCMQTGVGYIRPRNARFIRAITNLPMNHFNVFRWVC